MSPSLGKKKPEFVSSSTEYASFFITFLPSRPKGNQHVGLQYGITFFGTPNSLSLRTKFFLIPNPCNLELRTRLIRKARDSVVAKNKKFARKKKSDPKKNISLGEPCAEFDEKRTRRASTLCGVRGPKNDQKKVIPYSN